MKSTNYRVKILVALVAFGWAAAAPVYAQTGVLFTEYFDYTAGTALTANGWTAHSGAGTNPFLVGETALTYAGYAGSGLGKSVTFARSGEDVNRLTGTVSTGSVYAALMVNVSTATLAGDYFFHQGAEAMGNSFYNRLFVKRDADNNLAFGIQKISGTGTGQTYTGFDYELGKTYLIVVKYEFKSITGDDEVSIVVNPVGSTEPTTWSAVNVIGVDAANLGTVALRQGSVTNAAGVTVGGIRIGTSYSDVVGNPLAPPLAGLYTIPATPSAHGFALLSDAVAAFNARGASEAVVFSITESIIDTLASIRIDRQDLTEATPLIITAADGVNPVVKLRQLHNLGTDHVYILGSGIDIGVFQGEALQKAARKAIPSVEEGMKAFEDFSPVEDEWGPRNLTFVAANALGTTPFFLWEGSVTHNVLSGIKLTMTGTVGASAPGIRINRKDAVGAGQGGADDVILINIQIGAPEDIGKFQTAINVWGSSTGAFPARNVLIIGSDIHANHRGISTQVFADAAFMYNEISIYGNASQATHAGIDINTPVGQLTLWGNEIKKLQSVRTAATTMIGIQLTNSLNDNGVYVVNNMIAANYSNTNPGVTNHAVYGIAHTGANTIAEMNVYHNTIEINATGQTAATAALAQTTGSSSSAFYAYNNIFVNRTTGGVGVIWAGANLLSDYNNYVATTLKRVGTTNYVDITTLNASGRDASSVSADVEFVSASNLRLAGASLGDERLAGVPDTYITYDIDNNPKSRLAPYMGAYEGPALTVIATSFDLTSPGQGSSLSLIEDATDLITITWEPSYSTVAWGANQFSMFNDGFAHAGNGANGLGKYVGSTMDSEAILTTPVLQSIGELSFYVATYNNMTILDVIVEQTPDGENWFEIDRFRARPIGESNINVDWQKKTLPLFTDIAMIRFRVTGEPMGAVYFDDFTMTTSSNLIDETSVQNFESWTEFVTMRYTWHLDTPSGDFSAPVLSFISDDNGQTPSLTLSHADLDAAIATLNKGWGETYTGRWTVTAEVGETVLFANEPHSLMIRRIVNTSLEEREAPLTFALEQNYPNPFNPSTSIKFSLPETANVTLNVYTITGQLVATLVNEVRPAGVYNVSFDASNLASGVYMYRINAGGFTSTQKMTLIK